MPSRYRPGRCGIEADGGGGRAGEGAVLGEVEILREGDDAAGGAL